MNKNSLKFILYTSLMSLIFYVAYKSSDPELLRLSYDKNEDIVFTEHYKPIESTTPHISKNREVQNDDPNTIITKTIENQDVMRKNESKTEDEILLNSNGESENVSKTDEETAYIQDSNEQKIEYDINFSDLYLHTNDKAYNEESNAEPIDSVQELEDAANSPASIEIHQIQQLAEQAISNEIDRLDRENLIIDDYTDNIQSQVIVRQDEIEKEASDSPASVELENLQKQLNSDVEEIVNSSDPNSNAIDDLATINADNYAIEFNWNLPEIEIESINQQTELITTHETNPHEPPDSVELK